MPETVGLLVTGAVIAFALLLTGAAIVQYRSNLAARRLVEELRRNPDTLLALYSWKGRFQTNRLTGGPSPRKPFVAAVTPAEISIYSRGRSQPEQFTFTPDQIRWFGRPKKYAAGINELWVHLEISEGWYLLTIRLPQGSMRDLVRGLKAVAFEDLVTAYRRHRPYIHAGPVDAQPATQDIHGAWTLGEPVTLYLMPRFLVILYGITVLRKIPLEAVQQIGAFRRLDEPHANGLVCFRAEEETLAFALNRHEEFAQALAEAARRTLEAPIMQKQKKQDEMDDKDFD